MKENNLKISVLTPSFNSANYIERAIQSVLTQNYSNWEHIIVDGGSKDNTVEVLKKYSHLKWMSEPDKGQSDAMNKAYHLSEGDILVYLNSDDAFAEGVFVKVVEIFKEHSQFDMIVGKLAIIINDEVFYRTSSTQYRDVILYWKHLFPANPVSYFYKRHVQEYVGPFEEDLHYTMDYMFLLKTYRKFKVFKSDHLFGYFYFSETNKTAVSNVNKNLNKTVRRYLSIHDRPNFLWFIIKDLSLKFNDQKNYYKNRIIKMIAKNG